jgi:chromosome segregation ATPase
MPNDTPTNDTSGNDTPGNDTPVNDTGPTEPTGDDKPKETPAEELARLNKELGEKQAAQAKTGTEIDLLKSEITELGKAVAEIDKKANDWDAASKKIKQQQKEQQLFFDREKRELEATLSVGEKKVVTDAKTKSETDVAALAKKLDDLKKALPDKEKALAVAKANTDSMKEKYKAEVNLAEKDNALLKDLTTLHTDADSEEKKNNVMRQYFLILEGEDDLGKLDVPDVKTYTDRLNKAGTAVGDAADVERAAKDELAKAQVELKKAEKDWSDAVSDRRKKALASIPENSAVIVPG